MATVEPDHYRVLGVPVDAQTDRIKDAYRKLSRVYHPDLQGGSRVATERFQAISAAYTALSDETQREAYDRRLALTDPLRLVDDPRAERALDALDGLVGRLRRRDRALPTARRGRDLRVKAEIPLGVAALGGVTQVEVAYLTECRTCTGSGTTTPERNPGCHVCGGEGTLKVGLRRQRQTCGFCGGRGEVLLAPCDSCEGEGRVEDRRMVDVKVPVRMRATAVLRVRGAGERPIGGGKAGDVIVEAQTAPDPLLLLDGDDVVCDLPLTWTEALAGCVRTVPTLNGTERLPIPAGSWSGRELRVSGQGLPRRGAQPGRGDLRFRLLVDVPTEASATLLPAIAALEEQLGRDAFPRRARFEADVSDRAAPSDPP